MTITKCPFEKEELKKVIERVYGEGKHQVTLLQIDDEKCEVKWRFDNNTWIQGQSYNVLNVLKITGKNPLHLFKEEYKKSHPNTTGLSMPNLPAMLEAWAKEFNEKQNKKNC